MPKGTEDVVVHRPSTVDRLGDRVPGEVVGTLERCIIFPRSTDETGGRGRITIDGQTVWAPAPNAVIPDSGDEVEIRGELYAIEGAVGDWRKRGRKKGLLFECRRYGG